MAAIATLISCLTRLARLLLVQQPLERLVHRRPRRGIDGDRPRVVADRLLAMLSGFFGVLALLLAGIGVFGVTAYAVNRRRAEIGLSRSPLTAGTGPLYRSYHDM